MNRKYLNKYMRLLALLVLIGSLYLPFAYGANQTAPPSLKTVTVPEPPNLMDFVKDKKAAIRLGKALFWDMQLGSDGIQACASCHFQAGADNRDKNQLSPGLIVQGDPDNNGVPGDQSYQLGGPNFVLNIIDFPYHKLSDIEDRNSTVIFDTNDVTSSQGVRLVKFVDIQNNATDLGEIVNDPVFSLSGNNIRRVPPRNSPSVINAVFNFANFWDGRANNIFNGQNPFGAADADARIFVNEGGILTAKKIQIPNASLASQAVGPPLSDFEMSFRGRTFSKLGKKMLSLKPLGKQFVHSEDSVLGSPLSVPGSKGLRTTYVSMIKAAFRPEYWNSSQIVTFSDTGKFLHQPDNNDPRTYFLGDGIPQIKGPLKSGQKLGTGEFTQMEANFALFFGLAIQMYESTLIADDTPYDKFREGNNNALTEQQKRGLNSFINQSRCINCHGGPEFTNAAFSHIFAPPDLEVQENPEGPGAILPVNLIGAHLIERMMLAQGEGFYDNGFYNIGVRQTGEDKGRGGTDPFGFPLSWTRRGLILDNGGSLPFDNPNLPCGLIPCPLQRAAVDGTFKAPGLRNVELTGPYFHDGGQRSLRQVVDFYARGGDFHEANIENLDLGINNIGFLKSNPERKNDLVAFLLSLTDERVRQEKAPFDHPQLLIPAGSPGNQGNVDSFVSIPAVGRKGRPAQGLPPLKPFLNLDQFDP